MPPEQARYLLVATTGADAGAGARRPCCPRRLFHKGLSGGLDTISGMTQNFIAVDRDQAFLMPPSLREWLPEGHLAWCLLDVVAEMDLSVFCARYRPDGLGRPAYERR